MKRANFIGAPAFFNLNQACLALTEAFGYCNYLVGSAIQKRDYRDVDIRCILQDEEYERLFPNLSGNASHNALWSLFCVSISEWLSNRTGLPIDFQIQKQSEANRDYSGPENPRHCVGMFIDSRERNNPKLILDFIERLTPVQEEALKEYEREMEETVIPEIVAAIKERQRLAAEARNRTL